MATDTEDTGFLSRWSRRKAQVRQAAVVADPVAPVPMPAAVPPVQATATNPVSLPATAPPASTEPPRQDDDDAAATPGAPAATRAAAPPLPTLDDVAALTRDSDYSRFVGRSVQPDVRNAALGKLFTDPHFNVMDGLDTYIDDYGIPDPLPESMLRKMLQAKAMGLFADDPEPDPPTAPAPQPVAAATTPPELPADENTDLQLQPDDDAGRAGLEPGTGEDAGRAL